MMVCSVCNTEGGEFSSRVSVRDGRCFQSCHCMCGTNWTLSWLEGDRAHLEKEITHIGTEPDWKEQRRKRQEAAIRKKKFEVNPYLICDFPRIYRNIWDVRVRVSGGPQPARITFGCYEPWGEFQFDSESNSWIFPPFQTRWLPLVLMSHHSLRAKAYGFPEKWFEGYRRLILLLMNKYMKTQEHTIMEMIPSFEGNDLFPPRDFVHNRAYIVELPELNIILAFKNGLVAKRDLDDYRRAIVLAGEEYNNRVHG